MNEKGFNFYWENYYRAYEWQQNSNVSHWKARVKALEVENSLLRDFIHRGLQPTVEHGCVVASPCGVRNSVIKTTETHSNGDEDQEDGVSMYSESEIDEELLAFYEKTIRHKIERKKLQSMEQMSDDCESDAEKVYSMGPISSSHKSKDMALLYGKDAPKILSMELSMQINFDMNHNKSNAQLWPNIPLRLSR
ncbi:gem-associated protein 8-like [Thrips palmi]|uniref:Gem-associated protein 8-like n=1 Tax=Thrips palmi TaxID=161013 RepID=A0A6P8Z1M0_THRPL|nr:gem-associated protein 8-like [Thrips palmi]